MAWGRWTRTTGLGISRLSWSGWHARRVPGSRVPVVPLHGRSRRSRVAGASWTVRLREPIWVACGHGVAC